jgi:Holliday junction resolvase RusA-like endonuclease
MRQEFYIETIPQPQMRPKFARINGHVTAYDPAKCKNYKQDIKMQVLSKNHCMMEGPLTMVIEFHMMRPKAHYGKKGLKDNAPVWHQSTPDLDNMIKAVKDSLKGIVWKDDSQVCNLMAQKKYAEVPGILITIQNTP